MLPTWVLASVAILLLVYLWGTWTHSYFKKRNIPFDKPIVLFGSLRQFVFKKKSFAELIMEIYNKYKGAGLIGFFRMRTPAILVCDPALIKLITVKDFDHFTDHNSIIGEEDDPLFGKFLFSLRGDRWKYMRHTLSPAFTSSKMKNMFNLVTDCGEQLAVYLQDKCQEHGGVAQTDMKDLFSRYGNDVIATSAFGIQCDSLRQPDNQFHAMGKRSVDFNLLKITGFRLFSSLMRALKIKLIPNDVNDFFQSIVRNTIAQREKENIVRPDMIHLLMEARKGQLKSENSDELADEYLKQDAKRTQLTDGDIVAQAFIFFVAGFDTTSSLLCFICHHLATDADVMKRIQDEIDDVLAAGGGKLTYDALARMKYTDMVINETLRLWPPAVSLDRVCVKPYTIPAGDSNPSFNIGLGDSISIPTIAIQRDPLYFENPLKFDPERFSEENKNKIQPFTFFPFGAGPRLCIGSRFAVMETKIALASVLSRFDLTVVAKTQIPLVLDKGSVTLAVEGGFWLGISPRAGTL